MRFVCFCLLAFMTGPDIEQAAEEDQPEIAFMTAKKQSALGGRIRGMLGLSA